MRLSTDWEPSSHMYFPTEWRDLLHLCCVLCQRVSRTTHRLIRRLWPWRLGCKSSTPTCMAGSSLVTDHKPLTSILGPRKGVPSVAATHLQRWVILLVAYNYDIKFRSTSPHGNADALSRLPLPEGASRCPLETQMCNARQIQLLPVTSQQIRKATLRDAILSKVQSYILKGRPAHVTKSLQTYHSKIPELSLRSGRGE